MRRAKIIATIGPASSSYEVIEKLVRAGMNVARLTTGLAVGVLVDLQRPKNSSWPIRADGAAELVAGQSFSITATQSSSTTAVSDRELLLQRKRKCALCDADARSDDSKSRANESRNKRCGECGTRWCGCCRVVRRDRSRCVSSRDRRNLTNAEEATIGENDRSIGCDCDGVL